MTSGMVARHDKQLVAPSFVQPSFVQPSTANPFSMRIFRTSAKTLSTISPLRSRARNSSQLTKKLIAMVASAIVKCTLLAGNPAIPFDCIGLVFTGRPPHRPQNCLGDQSDNEDRHSPFPSSSETVYGRSRTIRNARISRKRCAHKHILY